MDAIDARREANKAAESLAKQTGCGIKTARGILKSNILEQYRIAVTYDGVTDGMSADWVRGWRKGF